MSILNVFDEFFTDSELDKLNKKKTNKEDLELLNENLIKVLEENTNEDLELKDFGFSKEQRDIITLSKEGKNIFVDAVIGSGKTTLLNEICRVNSDKNILYLTYNKLLKEDARDKIRLYNTEVQNFHGFVYTNLINSGFTYTNTNGILDFINLVEDGEIKMPQYDLIVLDEYQDINNQTARLLFTIDKYQEKKPQIIFVGDMKQKIYDTTSVNVIKDVVMNLRNDYVTMDLTKCFRISQSHAKMLGNIWGKNIRGVNDNQKTLIKEYDEAYLFDLLNQYENKDILILTPFKANVTLNIFLGKLERKFPEKYNKTNLYITIGEEQTISPVKDSMIVTTFDGAKGMERKLVVVFGFDAKSLIVRSSRGNKEVIRNLFLVAGSRGKEKIVFLKEEGDRNFVLNDRNFYRYLRNREPLEKYHTSKIFKFAYDSDIDNLKNLLTIKKIEKTNTEIIEAKTRDFNISLKPVINIYQSAMFFKKWSYDKYLTIYGSGSAVYNYITSIKTDDKKKQVLLLTALVTDLTRYANQAVSDYFSEYNEKMLKERLLETFDGNEEIHKFVRRNIGELTVEAIIDVYKDNTPYRLVYTDEIDDKDLIEIATETLFTVSKKGVIINTKTNETYEVSINDRYNFELLVKKTILK